MNVIFIILNDHKELTAKFIQESTKEGLIQLAGHRSVGGLRASIYNGMPAYPGDPPPDIKRVLSMPVDPFNREGDQWDTMGWKARSYEDDPDETTWSEKGVYDVHSASELTALDQGFLQGLYKSRPDVNSIKQSGEIARQIVRNAKDPGEEKKP